MKTKQYLVKVLFLFAVTGLFSSCDKEKYCVNGKGDREIKSFSVENFSGVKSKIDADIFITQGEFMQIEVHAQNNILDVLELHKHNDLLIIDFDHCVYDHDGIEIYISMPDIEKLKLSGSGTIETIGHFSNQQNVDIDISGSGKIIFDATANNLDCDLSGSGTIDLYGTAEENDINISGSGKIYAYEFPVEDCDVRISGSGACEVNVDHRLDVSISGSGNVYYIGECDLQTHISGSGDVYYDGGK
ncbi:MAG: DUF2807 domain-containing protein [Bacteroidales bacterium]|nr:DUF2807 domain-containing protein [Bacteroidales bacterium]